jgi:hypothetical protein
LVTVQQRGAQQSGLATAEVDQRWSLPSPPTERSTMSAIRWTAFMYRMPSRPSRHRVALWRDLHRLGAVNLLHATWAVPHGEAGPPDLAHLLATVTAAGGRASAAEAGGGGPVDDDLCGRLVEACERLWDGFINDVDGLEFSLAEGAMNEPDTADQVAGLRTRFVELVVQDLVQSGASVRAGCKLTTCAEQAASPSPSSAPDQRAVRHHVELIGAPVALVDGTVRYVAALDPAPSLAWERELAEFESVVYRPDPARVPFTHGVFVWACPSGDREPTVEQLQGRVRRFEQSLAE